MCIRDRGTVGHLKPNFRSGRTCFNIVPSQVLGACHQGGREKIFGYKQLHFYFGFQFFSVLQFLVAGKVNFDAEKVANLPTV